jgi:L-asparaginase
MRRASGGALEPTLTGAELVELVRWPDAPPLEIEDYAQVPGWEMHGELALGLARRCRELASAGSPVVVTHGTDTIEETVWLADRLLPDDAAPVVVTGAQIPASEPYSDGPRNFRDAVEAAMAPALRGLGALVCFHGELHAARDVRKVHTSAFAAFASRGYGPLGSVDHGRVRIERRPLRRPPLPDPRERLPRVDLVRLYAGADGTFVRASVGAGARAVVLEGTGRGNAGAAVLAAVRDVLAAGVVVAVCSRCEEGRVEPVYGRGGGAELAAAGALFGGDLAGPKVRILLQLALAAGVDPAEALAAEAG